MLGTVLSLLVCCPGSEGKAEKIYAKAEAARDDEDAAAGLALIPSDGDLSALKASRKLRDKFRVLKGELLAARSENGAAEALLREPFSEGVEPETDRRRRRTLAFLRCRTSPDEKARLAALDELRAVVREADTPKESGPYLLRLGTCLAREKRPAEARDALLRARDAGRTARDPVLEAQAESSLGNLDGAAGRFDAAIVRYAAALKLAQDAGAVGRNVARRAADNLGWQLVQSGDYERAVEILAKFRPNTDREKAVNASHLADAYAGLGEFEKAAERYEEALGASRKVQDRGLEVQIIAGLAALAADRGNWFEAARWNDESRRLVEPMGPSEAKPLVELMSARILLAQGEGQRGQSILRTLLSAPGLRTELRWQAHLILGRHLAAQGQTAAAESELMKSMQIVETGQTTFARQEDRVSFLSSRIQVYSEAIHLLLQQKREADALRVAERSRARALNGKKGPWKPREGATVLFYWLDEPVSHLWVIQPNGTIRYHRIPGAREIQELLVRHTQFILRARDPLTEGGLEARQLYEMLVAPAHLTGRVLIVPDGALHQLNWETLVAPKPDHYWIEDRTISVIPSVTRSDPERTWKGDRAVLVGDALSAGPEFGRLKHAGEELRRVAELFPGAEVLREQQATPAAALAALQQEAAIVHFAAHASAHRLRPLESAILLSDGGTGYKLYAHDVMALTLRAKMVTLSACTAAGSKSYRGEGLLGFAWAFLSAGAGNVVATLWEVDDAGTPQLMEQMYRQIRLGRPAEVALREAKLAFLRSETALRKPYYWAAFQHFQP